ncbi:MAG: hypothetical protein IPH62_14205 [Ignavibacteriae bacterium]|nr:hypothetical protein [Ignavibacteriota bacterium]
MKNKSIIVLLILISQITFASGGTIYTRYGVGDLFHYNSAGKLSLGGIGTALVNENLINLNNPSTWNSINSTKLGLNILANISQIGDGNSDANFSEVRFTGFHLAFPVERDLGIGFVFGLTPYSTINYDITNKYLEGEENSYTEDFIGTGGLSKVFFGFSTLLPLDFSVGATFEYYTGNSKYETQIIYNDTSDFSDSYFTSELKHKGLGTTIGFLTPNISSIFGSENIKSLRFGLSYEVGSKINTDSSSYATTTLGKKVLQSKSFKTEIPSKLSIGLNFSIDKYNLIIDYVNQPWSKFKQNDKIFTNLKDLNRYSLGIEYDKQVKKFATFWELVKYRFGLSYEQTQYTFKGEDINQFGIHTGISFPLGFENSIDLGLMYGIRGTTNQNLLKENILQATFSVNFGELWFVRQDR